MSQVGDDGAFYLSLGTMFFAFLGLSIKYCFYSKCSKISFCGFECVRDISKEIELREFEIEHNEKPQNSEDEKKENV